MTDDFQGPLETHLTFAAGDAASLERLGEFAAAIGWKLLHIQLACGETPMQPMLSQRCNGSLVAALQTAATIQRLARGKELTCVRTKIEATPHATGVPQTYDECSAQTDDRYFEHHIKVLLPAGFVEAVWLHNLSQHGAHLSRNALRGATMEDSNASSLSDAMASGGVKLALNCMRC
ncbi:MAG: hypothetical protein QM775_24550 [Pirellulales bacterium]